MDTKRRQILSSLPFTGQHCIKLLSCEIRHPFPSPIAIMIHLTPFFEIERFIIMVALNPNVSVNISMQLNCVVYA